MCGWVLLMGLQTPRWAGFIVTSRNIVHFCYHLCTVLLYSPMVSRLRKLYCSHNNSMHITVELLGSMQGFGLGLHSQNVPLYGFPVVGSLRHRHPSQVHSPCVGSEHIPLLLSHIALSHSQAFPEKRSSPCTQHTHCSVR